MYIMVSLSASEFKARCLAVLADVARTGESVTVLKRGRPIVRILPVAGEPADHPQKALAGKLDIIGDVIAPVVPADDWEAERA